MEASMEVLRGSMEAHGGFHGAYILRLEYRQ